MSYKNLNVLETQIVQRAYDNKWEKIVKVMDFENKYTYSNEAGVKVTLIPEKWIVTEVFDFIMEEAT